MLVWADEVPSISFHEFAFKTCFADVDFTQTLLGPNPQGSDPEGSGRFGSGPGKGCLNTEPLGTPQLGWSSAIRMASSRLPP